LSNWFQHQLTLRPRGRGFHLITEDVIRAVPELSQISVGIFHLHILHTSAGLTINENASPDVMVDLGSYFDREVPDGAGYFRHDDEGPDDMAAHIKSSIVGSSLSIPISSGRLVLGTWQGIVLCEFRDAPHARKLVATVFGA
jgi:secondary thiamine-phosphate synthase enzyme